MRIEYAREVGTYGNRLKGTMWRRGKRGYMQVLPTADGTVDVESARVRPVRRDLRELATRKVRPNAGKIPPTLDGAVLVDGARLQSIDPKGLFSSKLGLG